MRPSLPLPLPLRLPLLLVVLAATLLPPPYCCWLRCCGKSAVMAWPCMTTGLEVIVVVGEAAVSDGVWLGVAPECCGWC